VTAILDDFDHCPARRPSSCGQTPSRCRHASRWGRGAGSPAASIAAGGAGEPPGPQARHRDRWVRRRAATEALARPRPARSAHRRVRRRPHEVAKREHGVVDIIDHAPTRSRQAGRDEIWSSSLSDTTGSGPNPAGSLRPVYLVTVTPTGRPRSSSTTERTWSKTIYPFGYLLTPAGRDRSLSPRCSWPRGWGQGQGGQVTLVAGPWWRAAGHPPARAHGPRPGQPVGRPDSYLRSGDRHRRRVPASDQAIRDDYRWLPAPRQLRLLTPARRPGGFTRAG